jgi:hypothetical protein
MSRTKEDWFDQISDHVEAFKKRGGVVYEAEIGETVYNPLKQRAFVINNDKHKIKQGWKEGKTNTGHVVAKISDPVFYEEVK